MKNKVRKYLENHFITESFFFLYFLTHCLWFLQNPKLPNLSVSVIFIWISVQQVERFQNRTPFRYLETFIETFARKWLTAQSLGQEIWKVCFPKKIIRFISRCDWKDQNLWYKSLHLCCCIIYKGTRWLQGYVNPKPMNRKCVQCTTG